MATHLDRGGRSYASTPTLFIPVSADLIARLEAIVDAGIELLDAIGGDPDLEPSLLGNPLLPCDVEGDGDPDGEDDGTAEEGGDEHEPQLGASAEINQVLGWVNHATSRTDGCEEVCEDEAAQAEDHEDELEGNITTPDTSGGFIIASQLPQLSKGAVALRELFDPRLAARPAPNSRQRAGDFYPHPNFPHEPADREPFDPWRSDEEVEAFLRRARAQKARR